MVNSRNQRQNYFGKKIFELAEQYCAPKFIPHITTYGLVNVDLNTLENIVSNSIEQIKPFDVSTKNLEYSDNIWKTLFINIKMNTSLEIIFQNLVKHLGDLTCYDYSPHISLIYKNMSNDEKILLKNNLEIPKRLSINTIAIQEFSQNITKWKIVKEIVF